jgi:dihydrolipoamide dehydrogenase
MTMNETKKHDLVVIGAGPGGYAAAIRASQLGLDTACVEKEPRLGGTCLRVGCIPSKALLESSEKYAEARDGLAVHGVKVKGAELDLAAMMGRKDGIVTALTDGISGLFKANKVTRYEGTARLDGPGRVLVGDQEILADRIIIATGSSSAPLRGVEADGDRIGDSTAALAWPEVPSKLVVIGAGYIGLELGSVWSRLGSEVTMVEYLKRIVPGTDGEIARVALQLFKKQGLTFELGAKVAGARVKGQKVLVEIEGREPLTADRVLLAVGRRPHTEGLDLASAGVELDERGFIKIDAQHQAAPGVWALGDVVGGLLLAHKATEEGVAVAERLAGKAGHFDADIIPAVCYTDPEIAGVGRTEEELKDGGVPYNKGVYSFRSNGRAMALNRVEGRVKILAHKETDRVLGVHIIGPRAGDLIAEAAAAMAFGASAEDIGRVCHAHPTLAEAVKEAALGAYDRPLHG